MATINASVTLTTDIISGVSITKNMAMTKAGTTTGLDNTSGLSAKTVQSTTAFKLFDNADATMTSALEGKLNPYLQSAGFGHVNL